MKALGLDHLPSYARFLFIDITQTMIPQLGKGEHSCSTDCKHFYSPTSDLSLFQSLTPPNVTPVHNLLPKHYRPNPIPAARSGAGIDP